MSCFLFFFFFNDTATTEIYTLSLHDALPISRARARDASTRRSAATGTTRCDGRSTATRLARRSEEHTSELQSRVDLVCRLLLEKKKKKKQKNKTYKKKQIQSTNPARHMIDYT